ncbi:Coiled-coil domain-containing protein 130 [Talaromyces islandicus]|uniref:Coiled-coil domain-containing protein 130 n=1 Tax=Talaromyces islandicus TaxID=28573 RepID=A0A0U1M5F5_TALIS|nr:Coiled-coil domain-containing protein 130 [Talaromyces islandicus]
MQGFNMGRYVPPDQEGLTTGNKLAGKHALGARARHLQTRGALIVRFEMPFAIWCTNCKPHETIIGQGVRFNAEKKKVDSYYSTPIYSFRMKHTACGGWIEIRTDPKNTAYVVTEGARKRDTGDDKETDGDGPKTGLNERTQEENDPFAKLEGKVEDKRQFETATMRIQELQKRQRRDWEDPYEQSRRLRKTFRHERKRLERVGAANEALKDRMSLGIDLLEETEEDRLRASFVDFGPSVANDGTTLVTKSRIRPMFGDDHVLSQSSSRENKSTLDNRKGKLKSEVVAADRKALLSSELRGNTRAVVDPFLNEGAKAWQPAQLKARGIRDKRGVEAKVEAHEKEQNGKTESAAQDSVQVNTPTALVAYGSDSD